jgi:predicted nucleic acid-binding protein
MRVFLDTNVLIDVLAERVPFYADSAGVWTLAEQGLVVGLVSALSFTNSYYIIRRLHDAKKAQRSMHLLRDIFQIATCDQQVIKQAIEIKIKDFEDAVQYVSAVHASADCLVSRNPRHFPTATECPVLSPAEFLVTYKQP